MGVLVVLLVSGVLALSGCSAIFSESESETSSHDGLSTACDGLTQIRERFISNPIDSQAWWQAPGNGGTAEVSGNNLIMKTGVEDGDRGVTLGPNDGYEMRGILAIEVVDL